MADLGKMLNEERRLEKIKFLLDIAIFKSVKTISKYSTKSKNSLIGMTDAITIGISRTSDTMTIVIFKRPIVNIAVKLEQMLIIPLQDINTFLQFLGPLFFILLSKSHDLYGSKISHCLQTILVCRKHQSAVTTHQSF